MGALNIGINWRSRGQHLGPCLAFKHARFEQIWIQGPGKLKSFNLHRANPSCEKFRPWDVTTRLKLVPPINTLRVYESWVKIAYFNGIYDFSSTSIWTSIFEVWWDANYHILYQDINIIMAAFEMTSQNCKLSIQLLSYQISMQKSQLFNMIKLWLTYSTMLSWMLYSFFWSYMYYNACIMYI